jgi:hypothetical protein
MNALHIYADTAWHNALVRAQVRAILQPALVSFCWLHYQMGKVCQTTPLSTLEHYGKLLRVLKYATLELEAFRD